MSVQLPKIQNKKPETLTEWLTWLEQPRQNQIKLGLSRMREAAQILSCAQFSCPIILVAGTNGKGTTVSCLSTIYQQAGYQVGSYFSPHLQHFNERIQLNGKSISDAKLTACFSKIYEHCQTAEISYFEYTTLAALLYFSAENPDVIILEVGLGGRLDATNIIEPSLSIITTVDFDHQDILGDSLNAIGREKAGIMRSEKPCVLSSSTMPHTVYQEATRLSVPVHQLGAHYHIKPLANGELEYQDAHSHFRLHPEYHPEMQAGAVAAVRLLQGMLPVRDHDIQFGLANMQLSGRQTLLNLDNGWQVCIDVAHNNQSVVYLAKKIARWKWRPQVLFSCLADKDLSKMIEALKPYAQSWYLFPLSSPRALSPDIIAKEIRKHDPNVKLYIYSCAEDAIANLFAEQTDKRLLVCGSFHTAGEGLAVLKQHYCAQ